jgi:uncharacterized protein
MSTIHVVVKPNSHKTEILSCDEGVYRISVKAPPDKGKANTELVKFLSKHFGKRVQIISGMASKKKMIKIED